MNKADKVFRRLAIGKPSFDEMRVLYCQFLVTMPPKSDTWFGFIKTIITMEYGSRKFFKSYGWTLKEYETRAMMEDLGWPD